MASAVMTSNKRHTRSTGAPIRLTYASRETKYVRHGASYRRGPVPRDARHRVGGMQQQREDGRAGEHHDDVLDETHLDLGVRTHVHDAVDTGPRFLRTHDDARTPDELDAPVPAAGR